MKKEQLLELYLTKSIDSAYRFAFTYVKNTDDAEDIVNDSVIKAIKSIHTLRDTTHIKAWFYKIISNTAITYLKKKHRFTNFSEEEIHEIPSYDDYSDISLKNILEDLEVKYREVVVLRFLEDMQINEIAHILGINENTVKTRLYRALNKLKIEMEDEKNEKI